MTDFDALFEGLAEETREYVKEVTDPILANVKRIDALEGAIAVFQRAVDELKSIAREPGPKGDPGLDGRDGADGINGKDADHDAIVASVLAAIPAPKNGVDGKDGINGVNGKDGVNGTDADEDAVVARVLAAIPKPADGKDADEDAIVSRVLAAIPKPIDGKDGAPGKDGERGASGESVHPDTVALMVRDAVDPAVTKAVANIRLPKDGEPGRDATHIEFLPAIDPVKSYPRGTWAKHNGGTIMSVRSTDPVTTTLAAAGWEVMQDGLAGIAVEWTDERTCEIRMTRTSGEQTITKQTFAVILDRGVFKADRDYVAGDCVTWDGNSWIAQKETRDKPGTSDAWRLSVRKGQNGKDAVMPTKHEPVRLR